MKRPRSKFLNKECLISELSAEEPLLGTILGMFKEGDQWFYEVQCEERRFSLQVSAVNWIEIKNKRLSRKKKHKRRMGKVLQLLKP